MTTFRGTIEAWVHKALKPYRKMSKKSKVSEQAAWRVCLLFGD